MSVEERMAKIEGAFEQVDNRLNHIETEMGELRGQLRTEIGELRGQLGAEIRELRRSMFFLIIPMWITIIGAIIGVAVA